MKMQEDRKNEREFLSRFIFFLFFSLETPPEESQQNNFSSRTFLLSKTSHSESGRISLQFRKHRGGILPLLAPFIGIRIPPIGFPVAAIRGYFTKESLAEDATKCSKPGISYGSSVCKEGTDDCAMFRIFKRGLRRIRFKS